MTHTPDLAQLQTSAASPDKNVRREAITSIGYWLGKTADKSPLFQVLLIVQAIDQPGVSEILKANLRNPASSQAIIDALLANKSRIAPERIESLIAEPVDQLLQGNAEDLKRGVELSAAFGLKNTADRLHKIALDSPDNALRIAALDALGAQQNANPVPLTALLGKYQELSLATLRALANSRVKDADIATIAGLPEVPAQFRAQIIEILSSHKSGASALVAASLAQKPKPDDLGAIALNRLQTVLGNDAELGKLLDQLGDKFRPVLQLDGKDNAFFPTNFALKGAFTIEAWVRLNPGIDQNDSLGGAPELLDINFFGETPRIYGGSSLGDVIVAKKKITADLWTHVAVTRDASGACKIYLNGELDAAGFIEKEVAERVDTAIDSVQPPAGDSALSRAASALYAKNEEKIERYRESLREKVHERMADAIAQARDLDCECRDKWAQWLKDGTSTRV